MNSKECNKVTNIIGGKSEDNVNTLLDMQDKFSAEEIVEKLMDEMESKIKSETLQQ